MRRAHVWGLRVREDTDPHGSRHTQTPPTCSRPSQLLVFILPVFSPHTFPSFSHPFLVSVFAFLLSWFLWLFKGFFFLWVTPTIKLYFWAPGFICVVLVPWEVRRASYEGVQLPWVSEESFSGADAGLDESEWFHWVTPSGAKGLCGWAKPAALLEMYDSWFPSDPGVRLTQLLLKIVSTHTFHPKDLEKEAGQSCWVQSHLGLHTEFQVNQGYIVFFFFSNPIHSTSIFQKLSWKRTLGVSVKSLKS